MAHFETALKNTLEEEGGYVNDPQDPGGETYKGISRNNHPNWDGWKIIDETPKSELDKSEILQKMVSNFYLANFWNPINGDKIQDQYICESIFDFAVNAGARTSIRLSQMVLGLKPDGIMGPETIKAINQFEGSTYLMGFTIQKICRYLRICDKAPKLKKYFFGWVKRSLREFYND